MLKRPSPFPRRAYAPDLRIGRDEKLFHCVTDLLAEGYQVYKRGFPSIIAVKNCSMRMIVVNPYVTYGPQVLGGGRDAMSDAFERCFGVKYEIYENPDAPEPPDQPKKWI